jgi:hypothetical protein
MATKKIVKNTKTVDRYFAFDRDDGEFMGPDEGFSKEADAVKWLEENSDSYNFIILKGVASYTKKSSFIRETTIKTIYT